MPVSCVKGDLLIEQDILQQGLPRLWSVCDVFSAGAEEEEQNKIIVAIWWSESHFVWAKAEMGTVSFR